jgi:hypothetical protein
MQREKKDRDRDKEIDRETEAVAKYFHSETN